MPEQDHTAEAFTIGQEAARTAASWTVDGNTKPEAIAYVLALHEAGDDISQYLPAYPNLSGERADSMTPARLVDDMGLDWDTIADDDLNAICQAFEDGVAETFEDACVAELVRAAPKP